MKSRIYRAYRYIPFHYISANEPFHPCRAYPDLTVHLDTILARDDCATAMVHYTATGTCFGEQHGVPATGRRSVMSGVAIFVFDGQGLAKEIILYRQPTEEERALHLGYDGF
jgi:hypothetical protein